MANILPKHLKFLIQKVQFDQQIITYRLLSRELGTTNDEAKGYLDEYAQKASELTDRGAVSATYILIGELKEGSSLTDARMEQKLESLREGGEDTAMVIDDDEDGIGELQKGKVRVEKGKGKLVEDDDEAMNDDNPEGEGGGAEEDEDSAEKVSETVVLLVTGADLDKKRAMFASITSEHIYSVGPLSTASDLSHLTAVNASLNLEPKYTKAWDESQHGAKFGMIIKAGPITKTAMSKKAGASTAIASGSTSTSKVPPPSSKPGLETSREKGKANPLKRKESCDRNVESSVTTAAPNGGLKAAFSRAATESNKEEGKTKGSSTAKKENTEGAKIKSATVPGAKGKGKGKGKENGESLKDLAKKELEEMMLMDIDFDEDDQPSSTPAEKPLGNTDTVESIDIDDDDVVERDGKKSGSRSGSKDSDARKKAGTTGQVTKESGKTKGKGKNGKEGKTTRKVIKKKVTTDAKGYRVTVDVEEDVTCSESEADGDDTPKGEQAEEEEQDSQAKYSRSSKSTTTAQPKRKPSTSSSSTTKSGDSTTDAKKEAPKKDSEGAKGAKKDVPPKKEGTAIKRKASAGPGGQSNLMNFFKKQ